VDDVDDMVPARVLEGSIRNMSSPVQMGTPTASLTFLSISVSYHGSTSSIQARLHRSKALPRRMMEFSLIWPKSSAEAGIARLLK